MAKAKQVLGVQQAQPAQVPAQVAPKPEQVVKGTLVKTLAKELGVTGKKLRRWLRGQKFQRSGKLWDLPAKTVDAARQHFAKPAAEEKK